MAQHNELGKWGEDVAADFLVGKGFRIVERNWKVGRKEIDIIAMKDRLLLFVEVKTRGTNAFGDPYEAVDWKKRNTLITAMRQYIGINRVASDVRFDSLSVVGSPESYSVQWLEDAVSGYAR